MNSNKFMYDEGLAATDANYVPLTPLTFLRRSARVFPNKIAVIHGQTAFTYTQFADRCARLASALRKRGVRAGDTVSVLAPNTPAMLEAHFGVGMTGAVLNTINTRLDAATIAFILQHAETKVLIADQEYADVVEQALTLSGVRPHLVEMADGIGRPIGGIDYEMFLEEGNPHEALPPLSDEWTAIALNYTSGTTGDPKGVVYHHRGAYLSAIGNALSFGLTPDCVYLWTLPMFHCNGWTNPWAVTLMGGTHICLRQVQPKLIFEAIERHGVTHLCGAPIVLNMLSQSPERPAKPFSKPVNVATGGASPPSAVIEQMEAIGFRVTHLYGLTETFGPATICAWQEDWSSLDLSARSAKMARQGVPTPTQDAVTVHDPETGAPVPADGQTIGEVVIRGNTVMKGYLKNRRATETALANGWFHSGDLAVLHPDGYIEIKDRAKDIIISGGENISTLEIEEVLYRHPAVLEAAVVAKPDEKWGETPCAFVTLKPDAGMIPATDIIDWCRAHLAHFKCPRHVVFTALPKTSTGKIQKFQLREQAKTV